MPGGGVCRTNVGRWRARPGRAARGRTRSSAILLLAPLVLSSSGCFGLFHSMHHRHRAARAIFWTEVVALGLAFACDPRDEDDVLFSSESAAFLTVAMGCEIFDAWGLALTAPVEECDACAARAVVTPAGAAVTFRF